MNTVPAYVVSGTAAPCVFQATLSQAGIVAGWLVLAAPAAIGGYAYRHAPGSTPVHVRATGHCPNLSAPGETGAGAGWRSMRTGLHCFTDRSGAGQAWP